jgi:hypothetical protein
MSAIDPLTEFTHHNRPAPYRIRHPRLGRHVKVVPVRSKTGLVASRRGAIAHLDNGVAAVLEDDRLRFGARFMCGNGSNNVAILPDADTYGGICEACADAVAGPCVYRCLNASRLPIYIGSTERWFIRRRSHATRSPWWLEVADIQIQRYPTIFEARAVERLAIIGERPVHNKIFNRQPREDAAEPGVAA